MESLSSDNIAHIGSFIDCGLDRVRCYEASKIFQNIHANINCHEITIESSTFVKGSTKRYNKQYIDLLLKLKPNLRELYFVFINIDEHKLNELDITLCIEFKECIKYCSEKNIKILLEIEDCYVTDKILKYFRGVKVHSTNIMFYKSIPDIVIDEDDYNLHHEIKLVVYTSITYVHYKNAFIENEKFMSAIKKFVVLMDEKVDINFRSFDCVGILHLRVLDIRIQYPHYFETICFDHKGYLDYHYVKENKEKCIDNFILNYDIQKSKLKRVIWNLSSNNVLNCDHFFTRWFLNLAAAGKINNSFRVDLLIEGIKTFEIIEFLIELGVKSINVVVGCYNDFLFACIARQIYDIGVIINDYFLYDDIHSYSTLPIINVIDDHIRKLNDDEINIKYELKIASKFLKNKDDIINIKKIVFCEQISLIDVEV